MSDTAAAEVAESAEDPDCNVDSDYNFFCQTGRQACCGQIFNCKGSAGLYKLLRDLRRWEKRMRLEQQDFTAKPGDDPPVVATKENAAKERESVIAYHGGISAAEHCKKMIDLVRAYIKNIKNPNESIPDKGRLLEVAMGLGVATSQLFQLEKTKPLASLQNYHLDLQRAMIKNWTGGLGAFALVVGGIVVVMGGVCWLVKSLDRSSSDNFLTIIAIACLATVGVSSMVMNLISALNERITQVVIRLSALEKEVLELLDTLATTIPAAGPAAADLTALATILSDPQLATLLDDPHISSLLANPALNASAILTDPARLARLADPALIELAALLARPALRALFALPALADLLTSPDLRILMADTTLPALRANAAVPALLAIPGLPDTLKNGALPSTLAAASGALSGTG